MKFTLICEDEPCFLSDVSNPNVTKRTVEFNADTLADILFEVDLFLKGAGFHFDHLEVFNQSESSDMIDDDWFDNNGFDKGSSLEDEIIKTDSTLKEIHYKTPKMSSNK